MDRNNRGTNKTHTACTFREAMKLQDRRTFLQLDDLQPMPTKELVPAVKCPKEESRRIDKSAQLAPLDGVDMIASGLPYGIL